MAKRASKKRGKARAKRSKAHESFNELDKTKVVLTLLALLLVVSLIQTVQLMGMTSTPTASVVGAPGECTPTHYHKPYPPYEPVYTTSSHCNNYVP